MQTTPVDRFPWEKAFRQVGSAKWVETSTLAVGFYMATFANGDGTSVHPGVEKTAKHLDLSESTVKRARRALTANGWLTMTSRANKKRGEAAVYRLTLPGNRSAAVDQGSSMTPHQSNTTTSQASTLDPGLMREMEKLEERKRRDQKAAEERLRRDLMR